jgi:putative transposase
LKKEQFIMQYRRARAEGAVYFFTVNASERDKDLLVQHIEILRNAVRSVRRRHPFEIVAMCVMPDHLHAVWRLPSGDRDFPLRWSLIKSGFSRNIDPGELISKSRLKNRERGLWQRRYWEHLIRDETDLERHVNYIHFNPVKHGYVDRAIDWPYSSIHRYQRNGLLTSQWAESQNLAEGDFGEREHDQPSTGNEPRKMPALDRFPR